MNHTAQKYLDTKEASAYLKVSASFLNSARVSGHGPPFCKVGRLVRYSLQALDSWMAEREVSSTSEVIR